MKKIIWTCDTEIGELASNLENAYDLFVLGKVEGKEVGVHYINDIAKRYGASIHHFVDVYQPKYHRKIIDVCEKILAEGHSIGLHTHPTLMYGKRYMNEYSLSDQQRIIEYGQNFFRNNIGYEVTSHRAGGYGADCNTVLSLALAGIKVDSSYYHRNNICKLPQMTVNSISKCCNTDVIEIPVTVYGVKRCILGISIAGIAWQKMDFRYGSSVSEILSVVDSAPNDSVLTLFLHSFNFLRREYDFSRKRYINISLEQSLIEKFEYLLSELSNRRECIFSTLNACKEETKGYQQVIYRKARFHNPISSKVRQFV